MSSYPKILIPRRILQIIRQRHFEKPGIPSIPLQPEKDNNIWLKGFLLLASIVLIFFKPFFGILLISLDVFWIIYNPEKTWFIREVAEYKARLSRYEIAKLDYDDSHKMSHEDFIRKERKRSILSLLRDTTLPEYQKDYKKGASHDYFKEFLANHFGERIQEDAALILSRAYSFGEDAWGNEKRPYISDFAYVDRNIKLCIAIEIDEPYTKFDKIPIHLHDSPRNELFRENNWVVIRFAEEQVVRHPELCCKLIKKVIYAITEDLTFTNEDSIDSEVPKISCWTFESSRKLAETNYREKYLNIVSARRFNKTSPNLYTLGKIKDQLNISIFKMVRQYDDSGAPTNWLSHWDSDQRIRVTMEQSLFEKLVINSSINSLTLTKTIVPGNGQSMEYVRYLVEDASPEQDGFLI